MGMEPTSQYADYSNKLNKVNHSLSGLESAYQAGHISREEYEERSSHFESLQNLYETKLSDLSGTGSSSGASESAAVEVAPTVQGTVEQKAATPTSSKKPTGGTQKSGSGMAGSILHVKGGGGDTPPPGGALEDKTKKAKTLG